MGRFKNMVAIVPGGASNRTSGGAGASPQRRGGRLWYAAADEKARMVETAGRVGFAKRNRTKRFPAFRGSAGRPMNTTPHRAPAIWLFTYWSANDTDHGINNKISGMV